MADPERFRGFTLTLFEAPLEFALVRIADASKGLVSILYYRDGFETRAQRVVSFQIAFRGKESGNGIIHAAQANVCVRSRWVISVNIFFKTRVTRSRKA